MKKLEAYLSSTFFDGNEGFDKDILKPALLSYDKIYIDLDIENLPWNKGALHEYYLSDQRKASNILEELNAQLKEMAGLISQEYPDIKKLNKTNMEKFLVENLDAVNLFGVEKIKKFTHLYNELNEVSIRETELRNLAEKEEKSDLARQILTWFLEGNKNAFELLHKNDILGYIRKHPNSQIKDFFIESFENILKKNLRAIFHPSMYNALLNFYGTDYEEGPNDPFLRQRMAVIFQEIFVSNYLSTKHQITPILTWSELHARQTISSAKDSLPLHYIQNNSEYKRLLNKYFYDSKSFSELISEKNLGRDELFILMERSAPNFAQVPIQEIANFRKKESVGVIGKFLEKVSVMKKISNEDYVDIFFEELWKMGKIFSPSLGEVLVGILSEIPLPIPVNPISIFSTIDTLKKNISFQNNYGWFLKINKIRKLTKTKNI